MSTALPGDTASVISGNPIVLSGQFNGACMFTRGQIGLAQGFGIDIEDTTLAE